MPEIEIPSASGGSRRSGSGRLLLLRSGGDDLAVETIKGVGELEVVVLLALFRTDRRHLGVALCAFGIKVPSESRFAARRELIGLGLRLVGKVRHRDVGRDAGGLNGAARRRVVLRGREPERTAALSAQRANALHRSLAERG